MTKYTYTVGNSPQTDIGQLTRNPNGSLQQLVITDQLNPADSQTCTYTHDDLGRVASANCGASTWSQTFSYDPFGNITKTVPTGATGMSFQPSYDYTNNTNRITSSPFSYTSTNDPNGKNGNMTADNSHAYSWDTENKLTGIDSGLSNGICQTYDALGRVVEQDKGSACTTSPTSSTEIVYDPSGAKLALMNGSSLVKAFVPLPGGAEAVYNSSGLQYYRHADWLGSSRLATTSSRTLYYAEPMLHSARTMHPRAHRISPSPVRIRTRNQVVRAVREDCTISFTENTARCRGGGCRPTPRAWRQ
jgi:YD repeat-containing protein